MYVKKIKLPFRIKKKVLALGAQNKNTLCFMEGRYAYLSPEHKDLGVAQDFFAFRQDLRAFLKRGPQVIACDQHPGYSSSIFARRFLSGEYKIIPVQHHHAHIASCMLESGLKDTKVIGVAFDGTGFGDDNTLWGGEFLVCGYGGYRRAAHLEQIPLLGGEKAIREPNRLSAAWLERIYKRKAQRLIFKQGIKPGDWQVLKKMQEAGFNSPLTSSMGRLFDAAASLILKKHKAGFEGELAIALEKKGLCCREKTGGYSFLVRKKGEGYIVGPRPMFRAVLSGLKKKEPKETLALKFHLGVADMIKEVSLRLKEDLKVKRVVLSGGVFQNKLLLKQATELLSGSGFEVFQHKALSPNDSSLSLGQGVVADFKE